MRKEFLVIGIVLIVVGAIFIPTSRIISETTQVERYEQVVSKQGVSNFQLYLESGKYRIYQLIGGYRVGTHPKISIYDSDNNLLYDFDVEEAHWFYFTVPSGFYKFAIEGSYSISESSIDVDRFVTEERTVYPIESLLPFGLLLVVLGAGVTVVGAIIPSKKKKL
jgi:hypothetical protein